MTTPETPGNGVQPDPSASATTSIPGAIAPAPVSKPMGLALSALLVGIGAFLFGLIPVFGALVGIAAVVLGVFALVRRQSKGMAIAGLVLGGLAILSSMGIAIGLGAAVGNASLNNQPAVIAEQSTPEAEDEKPAEPIEEAAEPEEDAISPEFKSALNKAESYSEIMHMSKIGIYDQLVSEYGEKFTPEAAQYAVDNMQADWNANALAKAKEYQETMSMSPAAIRDQLVSEYGEKFTADEADYAVLHLND